MTVWLTECTGVRRLLNPIRNVAVVIASLCHDLGHEGLNNQFHINSWSKIAMMYNDRSVLESFHAAKTFRVLQTTGCQMLEKLEAADRRLARSAIIDLILDTDMKVHFEFVSAMKLRLAVPEFSKSFDETNWGDSGDAELNKVQQEADRDIWMVTRGCLKAADLGHSAKLWAAHFARSLCVTEEFFLQGDKEEALKLPISPLCNRNDSSPAALCKSQVGFVNFVCRELFVQLAQVEQVASGRNKLLLPGEGSITTVCLANMDANIEKWKETATPASLPLSLFDPPPPNLLPPIEGPGVEVLQFFPTPGETGGGSQEDGLLL